MIHHSFENAPFHLIKETEIKTERSCSATRLTKVKR